MASSTRAQSCAERLMGPSLSMVQLRAMAPVRGTNPKVGRRPVAPQRVEGEEIDPSVSEPSAKPTQPAATALAEPADDPLEPRAGFHGLRVRPPNHFAANGKRPEQTLRDKHGPRRIQALHDSCVFFKCLLLEPARAPRRRI